ncbi:MAG TPA: DUF6036 family nucleotidyltransferase [Labilithrix sp.]|nr:DUF6036 family nucleotidyltransferase [Labilithrix sp.]
MKRVDLEHVLRAACAITNQRDFIVIGSQSILGQFPDAPAELLVSDEVDIYPRDRPDLADLIDGAIGELSFFHDEFGYYAQGVGPTTAVLSAGWEGRLIVVTNDNTHGAVGHCLEIHDLLAAKYVAARDKDRRFCRDAVRRGLVDQATLFERIAALPVDDERKRALRTVVVSDFAAATT